MKLAFSSSLFVYGCRCWGKNGIKPSNRSLGFRLDHVLGCRSQEQCKANAVAWALQFVSSGVPADLTVADAMLQVYPVHHQAMASTGPLWWTSRKSKVYLRGGWIVDLDEQGNPDDPPHRM
jgi:hypothetical protein